MRRSVRLIAGVAAVALAVLAGGPAAATPHPRSEEWWFSAWGLEKDVWPLTRGAGVTVAVLDTGVNASLPELAGVVLKGADTTGRKSDGRKDYDSEGGGHGTGIATLIAGQGGGTTGFVGIAPEAKILPVHDTSKLGDPSGLYEALAAGIRFAVKRGAKVINISEGVTSATLPDHCESGVQDAIADAVKHDVVVVAASGNTGNTTNFPELPGSCAGVLTVGGIDASLRPWAGTQRQPYVAVAAPAVASVIGRDGQYYRRSLGTSISAALVSGAAALIRSQNPHMSARTVVQRLIATTYHPKSASRNDQTGYGPIQITSAMNPKKYPVPADAPNPVYVAFDKWQAARYGTTPQITTKPGQPVAQRADSHSKGKSLILPIVLSTLGVLAVVIVFIGWRRRPRAMM